MKSILLILFCVGSVNAGGYCISTSAQLAAAITSAENSSEDSTIRITIGSYLAPANGFFYDGNNNNNYDITFSGGWTSDGIDPCGKFPDAQVSTPGTTLNANFQSRVLMIRPPKYANVTVSGLTFINGYNPSSGGGLRINLPSGGDSTGTVTIEKNSFYDNTAGRFGAALFVRNANKIVVRNNLFFDNFHSILGFGSQVVHLETDRTVGIYAVNNTIIHNEGGLLLLVDGGNGAQAMAVNNLIWENDLEPFSANFALRGNGFKYVYNNNISTVVNGVGFGNISLPPLFENNSFAPSVNSPLINTGRKPPTLLPNPPIFNLSWGAGLQDIEYNPREVFRIDIGAYESPYLMQIEIPIFIDGFEG